MQDKTERIYVFKNDWLGLPYLTKLLCRGEPLRWLHSCLSCFNLGDGSGINLISNQPARVQYVLAYRLTSLCSEEGS